MKALTICKTVRRRCGPADQLIADKRTKAIQGLQVRGCLQIDEALVPSKEQTI